MSERSSISRNAALSLAGQLFSAAVTAGLTVYLARALGPTEFGIFAVALGIAATVLLFSEFGISTSAARYAAEHRDDIEAVAGVLASALRLKLLLAGGITVALFLLAGPIADAYDEPTLDWALRGMAFALFGQNLMGLYGTAFIALAQVKREFQIISAKSTVELIGTVVAVTITAGASEAAFGRAAGFLVGAAVGVALAIRLIGPRSVGIGVSEYLDMGRIARYAGALFVIDGAFALFVQIDVLLIAAILSATAAGVYQAPLRLMSFLGYPALAAANGVTPHLAGEEGGRNVEAFRNGLRYVVLFQAALVPPLVVWATPLIDLVLGPGYEEGAEVLRGLAPYAFLLGIGTMLAFGVNYLGEARRRVPLALGALAINIVIDLLLIEEIGIVAGAIGTDVAFFVYVVGHLRIASTLIDLRLRELAVSLGRALVAAAAMSGVLLLFGTGEVAFPLLLAGGVLASLTYVAVLVATRETTLAELRTIPARVLRPG